MDGTKAEELSDMVVPRKSAQRTNSSSSISSQSSTSSTTSTGIAVNGTSYGELTLGVKKKPTRGLWPAAKAEPLAGVSSARPQTAIAQSNGLSAVSALHQQSSALPLQQGNQMTWQMSTHNTAQVAQTATAVLYLLPINGTFERKTITVPFAPDLLRIGRQTNAKTVPTPMNGFFDSKVLSRQHAEIWAEKDGKIWIRDVKSSNGTFVNGKRLSLENRESEPHVLKEQDVLELGIDIVSEDQKTVVHHKVAARVEHTGLLGVGSNVLDVNSGDLEALLNGNTNIQHAGPRSRSSSQGSMTGAGRLPNDMQMVAANYSTASYHPKWLQPVTMEQIIRRLHSELTQARLQAEDLQHTENYVKAVLRDQKPLHPPHPLLIDSTSEADRKDRSLTELPAPPPQQPLPKKPDSASVHATTPAQSMQPALRRMNTERPKDSDAILPIKTESNSQILSLVDALSAAQKQISTQSARLKQMEEALSMEREARSHAEELVVKLESSTRITSTQNGAGKPIKPHDDVSTPSDPQDWRDQYEQLKTEVTRMRTELQQHRQRAEAAEDDSKRSRNTLFAMVENIRRRDAAIKQKGKNGRANGHAVKPQSVHPEVEPDPRNARTEFDNGDGGPAVLQRQLSGTASDNQTRDEPAALVHSMSDAEFESLSAMLTRAGVIASPDGHGTFVDRDRSVQHSALVQTAPFASILGVMLLGVGMMAYLNGWQKVADH